MGKIKIKNRKDLEIVLWLEKSEDQKGLAFVEHGLGGYKDQDHVKLMGDAFKKHGYTVIRFDTTNSFGESGGRYEDATTTQHYQDLEDVIQWASAQDWYQEPFVLAGHSLGGISTALYAENFPEKVKAVAPISTVVSGKLSMVVHPKEELDDWKTRGWIEKESATKPGLMKKLPWSHMEDRLKYDLLEKVDKLTMPVLLIAGENDKYYSNSELLFSKLPGDKEFHTIKGAPHTFRDPQHLKEIGEIFDNWIKNKL